jgi:hypothetical protein
MANQAEMKKMAIKAIEDDNFVAALKADPQKAAASIGITLEPDEVKAVKEGIAAVESTEWNLKGFIIYTG